MTRQAFHLSRMITSTLRFRLPALAILTGFVFVGSICLAATPSPTPTVAGGVWKTTDGGANWKPLFDKESISSIGAIAVAPSDHNVIYAGTGEAAIRGNTTYGTGVFKSIDGGKTWQNVGLKDSRQIGALIVDPRNENVVLVAALGHAFGPNTERGIFRTADGGKTWTKV